MSFPLNLKRMRENRGLSQSDLAKLAKFQPSAISHFETGTRTPTIANAMKLADALATSVDYLCGRINVSVPAYGPMAEFVLVEFGKMTAADQSTFVIFASMLANKPKTMKGTKP